ncbi:MAG: right-handed parallel beta-helix repeat-containing protein [Bacteroidales bacterium]|nr:right-handed parallel beta-helix repeat-containing protein [Bacteroidales bacterium]
MINIKVLVVTILQLFIYATLSAATYYVSPNGNNNNSGTSEDQPFQVVQYAIDQMSSGDTLIVLDGFYTGTLKLKSGISIQAKKPRKVVFSGAEPLEVRFKTHKGNIYKVKVDKEIKQLFFNDKPMTWAQWPNMQWSENNIFEKKWAKSKIGTGPGVLTSDAFSEIKDLDVVGGYCFIRYGKGNSCYSRKIESFDGKILHWNDDNFYSSRYTGEDGRKAAPGVKLKLSHQNHPSKSEFFLAGDLDLLDVPGEWFVEDNILYFYPPEGIDPNRADILIKTNDYSIDQSTAVSDVTIDGIDFMATSVKLDSEDNKNINFHNSYFTYIGAEFLYIDRPQGADIDKPIYVKGTQILVDKCLFAGAQNTALKIDGGNITVQNCVFIENNRHANFESRSLLLYANDKYKINRNTFFNNASDAIRIVPYLDEMRSLNPEVSYNHIFNGGKYNSDVSGIYMPTKSQKYAEVHHNWIHNLNGNCIRLDLAGKELSVHHNVTWSSYRGMTIEGYEKFNIYNNTALYNETPSDIIRNVLNHSGVEEASLDLSFPPIDDWNVLNNLVEQYHDRVGPREKITHNESKKKGILHPERDESWLIPIIDRGSIQGNLIGERHDVFTNADLSDLNLIPNDNAVKGGVKQSEELRKQGVCCLDSFRGAYDVNGDYWYPGSNWMPYGLPVIKTMAEAERFAKKYHFISIVPENNVEGLQRAYLNLK